MNTLLRLPLKEPEQNMGNSKKKQMTVTVEGWFYLFYSSCFEKREISGVGWRESDIYYRLDQHCRNGVQSRESPPHQ